MQKFTKLAALGAMAAAGGLVALYLFLLWAFRPALTSGAPGATGGMDVLGWQVLAVAMVVPVAILAAAHFAFGRQLVGGPKPLSGD